MDVLVTGATGFIGSNLARRLVELGYPVRILMRKKSNHRAISDFESRVKIVYGDVTDKASLCEATKGVSHIYHCAGKAYIGSGKREQLYNINVAGTRNLLEAARENGVSRVVYTSSVSAIGITGTKKPADESQQWNLGDLKVDYYTSKHLAELEVAEAVKKGLDCVIVNPSYVFGAGDINFNAGMLIRDLYLRKVPFYPSGGVNVSDIEDVVDGHLAAMEKGRIGERYILGGKNLSYKELFDLICSIVGAPKVFVPITESIVKIFVSLTENARKIRRITALANREILLSATKYFYYTPQKAIQELGLKVRQPEESIVHAYEYYKMNHLL
jgi:dihydroflavonol-4-reductase